MDDMADSKIQCEIGIRESTACNDTYHKATFQRLLSIHSLLDGKTFIVVIHVCLFMNSYIYVYAYLHI